MPRLYDDKLRFVYRLAQNAREMSSDDGPASSKWALAKLPGAADSIEFKNCAKFHGNPADIPICPAIYSPW